MSAMGCAYPQDIHRKGHKMVHFGQLKTLISPDFDEESDLLIDFVAFEASLEEFCETQLRNPKAKELHDMIQRCRLEE